LTDCLLLAGRPQLRIEYNAGQIRKTGSHHRVNPGGGRCTRHMPTAPAGFRHKKAPDDAGAFEQLN
jgi:hypothetical protein